MCRVDVTFESEFVERERRGWARAVVVESKIAQYIVLYLKQQLNATIQEGWAEVERQEQDERIRSTWLLYTYACTYKYICTCMHTYIYRMHASPQPSAYPCAVLSPPILPPRFPPPLLACDEMSVEETVRMVAVAGEALALCCVRVC
jgi:hypothetical protein